MIPLLDVPGAAAAVRDGELVALPTETVYGLGGDALNPEAVAKIFQAKGRPQFNPIICHLPNAEAVFRYGRKSRVAEELSRFWPGPLTLLLPREDRTGRSPDRIPSIVTAGSPFAGFRVPDHPLALEFLRACETPIAAPSANRSGRRSPTTAAMVQSDYANPDADADGAPDAGAGSNANRIAGILDGGPCDVGVESTVVAIVSEDPPTVRILRPGGVSREQLASAGFRLDLDPEAGVETRGGHHPAETNEKYLHAPGRLLRHYGPGVPLLLIDSPSALPETKARNQAATLDEALRAINPDNLPLTWLGFAGRPAPLPVQKTIDLSPTGNFSEAARRLFAEFDRVARSEPTALIAGTLPARDLGVAVNDRLTRAATRTISLTDEH